ncbi:CRTAC1 family protein [Paludibaculum fermentans]|uniref:CRTAC1 family protein n=1 Tax=Paludibaculum fermentans TaxID=1473598 RepID=A0A7S7NPP3_PALFE|nr:CRTAC1 family protein [Paludibaculum fermentans]QOY87500.1 CRTAC1 family protein [Paludibaculum fermentans]
MRLLIAVFLLSAVPSLPQGMASRGVKPQPRPKLSGKPWPSSLVNVASKAGLTHTQIYGAERDVQYVSETSSGGVAFLDYDNDGFPDIFFVGGTRFGTPPPGAGNRLYHNNHDGTFTDVTAKSGLARVGWGQGVAVADYDNDGYLDLFVTYWGENALYRNNHDGTFTDVARKAGLIPEPAPAYPYWYAGATWLDYDRDGRLDLFVATYIDFDLTKIPKPGQSASCNWKGVMTPCGPRGLKTGRQFLYHQKPDGTFEDVSQRSGIGRARSSFGLTAIAADLDGDGWPDIYLACDSTPSLFFRNNHDGTFSEEGIERGIALNDDGMEQAGMGLAIGDFNADGILDIFKTHFADDTHILYEGLGKGQYRDITQSSGIGVETRFIAWGAGMPDLDNDGLPDLFLVTGNVYPDTERDLPAYPSRMPPLLFRNLGAGRFEQLFAAQAGPAMDEVHSSRGAAFGDFDNDGDLDVVVWNRNETPALYRNDLKSTNHWLKVKLEGTVSNRAAIGAQVTVEYGDRKQVQAVLSQASFTSHNDLRLHFGLGASTQAAITIRWPNGQITRHAAKEVDKLLQIKEPAN